MMVMRASILHTHFLIYSNWWLVANSLVGTFLADLGGDLVAWQGFYQSISPVQNGLLVSNLGITANAFLDVQYLPDYLGHSLSISLGQTLDARGNASRAKRLKVETTYSTKFCKYRYNDLYNPPNF